MDVWIRSKLLINIFLCFDIMVSEGIKSVINEKYKSIHTYLFENFFRSITRIQVVENITDLER